jgi:hypothetical protein
MIGYRAWQAWLCAALALLTPGCGWLAIHPPTPAAALNDAGLDHREPGEHFYVLVFAAQNVPRLPSQSHTWVTVVRTVDQAGQCPVVEAHTISWLPATLDIRPLRLSVEPGINLGLQETLHYVQSSGEHVSLWGPYECRPSFFRRFLVQKAFLESGRVGYQCIDNIGEAAQTGNGCCCIHAISDMDADSGRACYPLKWFGDAGSENLVLHFRESGALLHPEIEHEWLVDALGLRGCGLVRRHC